MHGLAFDNQCVLCGQVLASKRGVERHYENYTLTGDCGRRGPHVSVPPQIVTPERWKCVHCAAEVAGGAEGREHARVHLTRLRETYELRGAQEREGERRGFMIAPRLRQQKSAIAISRGG